MRRRKYPHPDICSGPGHDPGLNSDPDLHLCTECGLAAADVRNVDAAGDVHWFHDVCLAKFRWWLKGHDTKLPEKYFKAAMFGVQLPMKVKRTK